MLLWAGKALPLVVVRGLFDMPADTVAASPPAVPESGQPLSCCVGFLTAFLSNLVLFSSLFPPPA